MIWLPQIQTAVAAHGLELALVAAVVSKESSEDPDAWNPEPRYRYFWNVRTGAPFRRVTDAELADKFPPRDFPALMGDDQEWWGQQASWGLMQIMGAVARERGFKGKYLTRLCSDPALNLDLGAGHLAGLVTWANGIYAGLETARRPAVTRAALAAYNGGKTGNAPSGPLRNGAYADDVLERYRAIKARDGIA